MRPLIRAANLGAALSCLAVLAGCGKEQPPEPPALPALSQQGLALSSWQAASPDPQDRLLLAHAMAKGKTEAMVMVATRIGSTPAVATAIASLGGDIGARFDDVGYLRVRLPLDRLAEVNALPDVLMAHIDGGGLRGQYSHDRDLINYELTDPPASTAETQQVTLQSTDSLVGEGAHDPSAAATFPTLSADIEALLRAAADPQMDVLTRSSAGGRFPEAGEDSFALLADRAIEVQGKPFVSSAGDAGRVESINGTSSSRRVLAVGEYWSALSFRDQFGFNLPTEEMLATWSSRGPAANGGAKPDLLALSSITDGDATDAVANLITAARQENLPADARHISWALRMGARRLQDYQAHEQGYGAIDVARALDLLKQQQSRQFELPDIVTRAPVKTYLARFLPEPGVGHGLYEREGWLVGQQDTRTITLIRQNGAATPLTYLLRWQGNDGTFATSEAEVVLPLNVPVPVQVEIAPEQVGIHSAHLYLVDKASDLPVHAIMATVIASEQFTAANGYTIKHREPSLPGLRSKSYFLEVPPNVAALRVDLAVGGGQVEPMLSTGGPLEAGFNLAPATRLVVAGKPVVLLVPNPPPGVYELALLPFGLSKEFTRAPYKVPGDVNVSASIHYVDTQFGEESVESSTRKLWMTNIYAPLQRSSLVAEVGAQRVLEDVAGASGMRAYNINVQDGSSSLRIAASAADGKARMGIYLYDCAAASCKLWGSDVFTKTLQKALVVPTPRAGLWKAVIDTGVAGAAFKYSEIMTHPRFGVAKVDGEDAQRRTGARWNQAVSYEIAAPVPFGYEAVGVMDVLDPGMEADERAAPYGDWQTSGHASNRPVRLATQVIALVHPAKR